MKWGGGRVVTLRKSLKTGPLKALMGKEERRALFTSVLKRGPFLQENVRTTGAFISFQILAVEFPASSIRTDRQIGLLSF